MSATDIALLSTKALMWLTTVPSIAAFRDAACNKKDIFAKRGRVAQLITGLTTDQRVASSIWLGDPTVPP